jgi:hypothetical protein
MINQIMINFIQVNWIFWEGIWFYLTKDKKHVVERFWSRSKTFQVCLSLNLGCMFSFFYGFCSFESLWELEPQTRPRTNKLRKVIKVKVLEMKTRNFFWWLMHGRMLNHNHLLLESISLPSKIWLAMLPKQQSWSS